jgi:hypothetical protein
MQYLSTSDFANIARFVYIISLCSYLDSACPTIFCLLYSPVYLCVIFLLGMLHVDLSSAA